MRAGSAMLVGYIDENDRHVCGACWPGAIQTGAHTVTVLNSESDDPTDTSNFWVVDECAGCGERIKYKGLRDLA